MGKLITLEGTDGCGKTTQCKMLQKLFQDSSDYIFTRNPGGTDLGIRLRHILLTSNELKISPEAELFIYMADRAHIINDLIKPALDANKIIISDRFSDSTIAYQGYARGLDIEMIKTLNKQACQGIQPDITIILDINPEIALQRAEDANRFEAEGLEFQQKVRQGFLELAENSPRHHIIRADNLTPDEVHQQILKIIQSS